MNLKGKKIGVAFTGSFCTYESLFGIGKAGGGRGKGTAHFFGGGKEH